VRKALAGLVTLAGVSLAPRAIWAAGADTPFDLVLVLDTSPSMADPDRFIAAGAHLAALELSVGDRVAVITTGSRVKWHSGLTSDRAVIERTFRNVVHTAIVSTGKRLLYDAAWSAVEGLPITVDGRRRSIILITNDADRGSTHSPEELARASRTKDVTIRAFLIRDPYPANHSPYSGPPRRPPYPDIEFAANELRAATDPTGGAVSFLNMDGYILTKAIVACKGGDK